MTQAMLALASPDDAKPQLLFQAAKAIRRHIEATGAISSQSLKFIMKKQFGATDASGRWSMRDAYEALEAAQVLMLADPDCPLLGSADIEARFKAMIDLERSLPTQTYRSERQIDLQQFSTPLTLAWLAAVAAQIDPDDLVLEPSAGTGMMAVHARRAGAALILNERDAQRGTLLAQIFDLPVTDMDAEYIDDLLGATPRPSVVLINPPFSRSAARGNDRHAGARHLKSALARLAPGGRCVAIMPGGFARDGTGAKGYAAVCEAVAPRVEIDIFGNCYAKHGTSVDIRLIVFDKGWTGTTLHARADTIADLPAIVRDLPPRLSRDVPPTEPAPAALKPVLPQPAKSQGLLRGLMATPLAAPAPSREIDPGIEPLAYTIRDDIRPAGEPIGIYAPWQLARIDLPDAALHPDTLVESLAMASVPPPIPSYRPHLPGRSARALSEAQLEAIIQAGEAFSRDLPGRFRPNEAGDRLVEHEEGATYRAGFFIGDGTGVGKGREAAGCIMDGWCQERRKALWLSKSAALIEDARRDWSALGGLPIDIQGLDAFALGEPVTMQDGILFCTYATLRSQRHDETSRLDQILDWLTREFDGVIVIDEAHALANAAGTETEFGAAKGSEQGLAGVRLQNALPRARILYLSATGATDPANLCYAGRLGIWGPGTAFEDRSSFMGAMEAGGIAALEIVARDLKAMGFNTARALSFEGVEYEPLEHRLTPDQIQIYDAYADAWAIIHANLDEALKAANVIDGMSGDTLNAQARGAAVSKFESAKQRFFSQLLIALKMPTLIRAIQAELDDGHAVVVQLVTTAEAILDRRIAELSDEERAAPDLDLSPREAMIDYLAGGFPIRQLRAYRDRSGTMRSELMSDDQGNPVFCQDAIERREALIEQLCAMPPVPAALDALIWKFGSQHVAEVTGRSRRIVPDAHGRQKIERRSQRSNIVEADAFMDGRKRILVFSDAGGTGRSYHADRNVKSGTMRRIHFLLEPGWRAAAAVQGLGRTHRTNQTIPPVFRPVTTDCKGERRFISTIARRLDSLGALTRGQRQTGGQNLFDPADNLESDYAKDALIQWYHLLYDGKLTSVSLRDFVQLTGLKLTEGDGGGLLQKLPPIHRWLNRILALRIAMQNAIFEEYLGLISARIDAAREAGTLDVGVETIMTERFTVLDDRLLRTDPATGAETRLQRLELHLKRHATSHERLRSIWADTPDVAPMRNTRSGGVALRVPSHAVTDEEGRIISMCRLIRPASNKRVELADLWHSNWTDIDAAEFETLWNAEVAAIQSRVDVETVNIVTGLLLPVWNKLPEDDVRVWRIADGSGHSLLGRIVPDTAMGELAAAFDIEADLRLSPAQLIAAASQPGGVAIFGFGEARLAHARVNGEHRIEIRAFPPERRDWLKSLGCFVEIIAYKSRLFVPVDRALPVLSRIVSECR